MIERRYSGWYLPEGLHSEGALSPVPLDDALWCYSGVAVSFFQSARLRHRIAAIREISKDCISIDIRWETCSNIADRRAGVYRSSPFRIPMRSFQRSSSSLEAIWRLAPYGREHVFRRCCAELLLKYSAEITGADRQFFRQFFCAQIAVQVAAEPGRTASHCRPCPVSRQSRGAE